LAATLLSCSSPRHAQRLVAVRTPDGGAIAADLYGAGDRGVVLVAHGGYSSRASWAAEARVLADRGFRVLVFETRAAIALRAGNETECLYDAACMAVDVLAAVRHLRREGTPSVAVIGGSAGGGAAAQASIDAPGEIDRLVLLAPMAISAPERMGARKLFVTSRDDLGPGDRPRLPGIRDQYERAPGPKQLVILDGSAHGQRLFASPQRARLMREILRFLMAP